MQATEVGVIIGSISALVVGIAGVFLKYLTNMSKQDRHERMEILKMNSDAIKMLSESLSDNTKSNKEIATATKRSADEAKERNGHLAEIMVEARDTAVQVANRNYECIKVVSDHHVGNKKIEE